MTPGDRRPLSSPHDCRGDEQMVVKELVMDFACL